MRTRFSKEISELEEREIKYIWQMRISVNPIGRFGFIRSLFHLLFRPCQFYLK